MKSGSPFYFLFLFFLANCRSPSEQINDAFTTVDQSLVKTNDVIGTSAGQLYADINAGRRQHESYAIKADSVYFAAVDVSRLLDSLKQIIKVRDSSGERLSVASELLIASRSQQQLTKAFIRLFAATDSYRLDERKRQKLDSFLLSVKEVRSDKHWTKKYFERVPTYAAIVLLDKFQNDCMMAAEIVLADIKQQVVN
ncbi:MAG TPA: hypothetical protein VFR58_17015 [Flavisolibacter sp.]|nr:hypothetical protein [Flavisolibacter sp.]